MKYATVNRSTATAVTTVVVVRLGAVFFAVVSPGSFLFTRRETFKSSAFQNFRAHCSCAETFT